MNVKTWLKATCPHLRDGVLKEENIKIDVFILRNERIVN